MTNTSSITPAQVVNTRIDADADANTDVDSLNEESVVDLLVANLIEGINDTVTAAQIHSYLSSLPISVLNDMLDKHKFTMQQTKGFIGAFVNGAGLACPMPLLKTKVALRGLPDKNGLYVIATDPHSQADISAFCQQTGYSLLLNTVSNLDTDTIFHFIITKTDSN